MLASLAVPSEYPSPQVREQQTVVVHGVNEVWQLRWIGKTHSVCEPTDGSFTCPCMGFAFGEGGDMSLIRTRGGVEVDRLHVTPLFDKDIIDEGHFAIVQRWMADLERDFKVSSKNDFPSIVNQRHSVQVMNFHDYDHNGSKNEFYLQTEAKPCGRSFGVVIGVSKANPRLHALGTVSKPDKPLYLQKRIWEALRDATGSIDIVDWRCGDHGSQRQVALQVHWSPAGIDGTRREFDCTADDKTGKLLSEEALQ